MCPPPYPPPPGDGQDEGGGRSSSAAPRPVPALLWRCSRMPKRLRDDSFVGGVPGHIFIGLLRWADIHEAEFERLSASPVVHLEAVYNVHQAAAKRGPTHAEADRLHRP